MTVPPSVTDLKNSTHGPWSINFTWQPPDTKCVITRYFISYDGAAMWGDNSSDAGSDNIRVTDDNNEVTYTLIGLMPYSNYSVQVLAESSEGNGTSKTLEGLTTLEDGEFISHSLSRDFNQYKLDERRTQICVNELHTIRNINRAQSQMLQVLDQYMNLQ